MRFHQSSRCSLALGPTPQANTDATLLCHSEEDRERAWYSQSLWSMSDCHRRLLSPHCATPATGRLSAPRELDHLGGWDVLCSLPGTLSPLISSLYLANSQSSSRSLHKHHLLQAAFLNLPWQAWLPCDTLPWSLHLFFVVLISFKTVSSSVSTTLSRPQAGPGCVLFPRSTPPLSLHTAGTPCTFPERTPAERLSE